MMDAYESSFFVALFTNHAPMLFLVIILVYLCKSYFAGGLHRYPGPFLAKFGKLWHRRDLQANHHQLNLTALHHKLGDVVRIGPKTVSISNPNYIQKVYGVVGGLRKSDMYDVFAPRINGKVVSSLISERDPKTHTELHKPMAKEFSVSVISDYETLVDKTLRQWTRCIDQRFVDKPGEICDMAVWTRLYAMEAIMDITFSESMGFIDQGGDVDEFLTGLDIAVDEIALLASMPWTSYFVKHNPVVAFFQKDNTMFPGWAQKRISARIAARSEDKLAPSQPSEPKKSPDFLDRFLDAASSESPPGYDFPMVMKWCLVNIFAGGDTTAVGLAAIVYYILRNPDKLTKLSKELRGSDLSSPVTWKECQAMPYLDACIREGWRLHPSIGMSLEREGSGLVMPDGYVLPPGTKVGMNAWVVNRQPEVFGDYVDEFLPERWLQQEDESMSDFEARTKRMKGILLNFGAGSRACTGRHVAYMETYKVVATLFREYDVALVNPEEEWETVSRWLTRVNGIRCTLQRHTVPDKN